VQAANLEYSAELRKEEKRVKNEVESTSSMSATSKEWQLEKMEMITGILKITWT